MENNIQSILKQMTLEEKAALCTGASAWTTTPIERLGIPEMIVSDGPHGIRRVADADSLAIESLATHLFPHGILYSLQLEHRFNPPDGAGHR